MRAAESCCDENCATPRHRLWFYLLGLDLRLGTGLDIEEYEEWSTKLANVHVIAVSDGDSQCADIIWYCNNRMDQSKAQRSFVEQQPPEKL